MTREMKRVVVLRTAWMERYQGPNEASVGGGAYVKEMGYGHEAFNFQPCEDGKVRGYVRTPRGGQIHVEKLGAEDHDAFAEDVTVFWVATHPTERRIRVVGWYDDAVVFRELQQVRAADRARRVLSEDDASSLIHVESSAWRLLPTGERSFEVPRASAGAPGGMGQSNVWYPPLQWARKLLAYRAEHEGTAPPPPIEWPVGNLASPSVRSMEEELAEEVRASGRGFITMGRRALGERLGVKRWTEKQAATAIEALWEHDILIHPEPHHAESILRLYDMSSPIGMIAYAILWPVDAGDDELLRAEARLRPSPESVEQQPEGGFAT